MTTHERALGKIITFYSSKGGTGRSMTLANVAWVLANNGKRVLAIDWDLEAPGLHRYLHPFLEDSELSETQGLIDYLVDVTVAARLAQAQPVTDGDPTSKEPATPWWRAWTSLLSYTRSIGFPFPGEGTIDLVPAGQQGPAYAERVATFDWRGFYDRLGGGVLLEALKVHLRNTYDYILIDSRTGISPDTAGICTVQMPDALVVCFTLNRQSVRGAAAAVHSAWTQRLKPDWRAGLARLACRDAISTTRKKNVPERRTRERERDVPALPHAPAQGRPRPILGTDADHVSAVLCVRRGPRAFRRALARLGIDARVDRGARSEDLERRCSDVGNDGRGRAHKGASGVHSGPARAPRRGDKFGCT